MNDDKNAKCKAIRVTFDMRQIFPCEDPLSVPLLRLMAATNDARYVMELSMPLMDRTQSGNEFDTPIINGKLLYLFRLLCGHLYEAGQAFRELDNARSNLLDEIVQFNPKSKKYLAEIRDDFSKNTTGALHYSFLFPVRNRISFHYKSEPIASMLEKHNEAGDLKGTIIIAGYDGLSRHIVSDHLAMEIVQDVLGGNSQDFEKAFYEKMGEVVDLAGQLSNLVDRIVQYRFRKHESAILEQKDCEIQVTQEFQSLVDRLMKKGSS